jgi:hypothetical protein
LLHREDLAHGGGPQAMPPWAFERHGEVLPAHQLRARWMRFEKYQRMRNAAWMVRNSRVGGVNNPLALQVVLAEAMKLTEEGEQLFDIIEALAELLMHP